MSIKLVPVLAYVIEAISSPSLTSSSVPQLGMLPRNRNEVLKMSANFTSASITVQKSPYPYGKLHRIESLRATNELLL